MPLEQPPQPERRRALSKPSAASSTAAAWNAFLLRPEARAWISATELGQRQPEVGDVALEVLLLEYRRPARLALGLVSSVALVVAATLSVATVTALGPFWVGESGALFGFVVLIGFAVALTSVVILLRLQVSENRIIRAISVWTDVTPLTTDPQEAPTGAEDTVDRREAVALRALFLAVSGAGIAATVVVMVWLSSAEGGSFVLPLLVAAVLQLIIWLAVCSGVVRVLQSSRV
ncbi:hypothetical protein [Plantibacter sp. MMLR14_011]|uniref:hypothetical protein n=1 Tax=Plantibacter sp. MMLR14_011 TaxID=1898746 RepID=UPI0008DD44D4|nr:hypothetical protein [Plantibacter sp. MMLR14_011]OII42224.1 hypothetical protein BIU99_15280 [Plantibacter sp. MMLR14_011]